MNENSVTVWLHQLGTGDQAAAQRLWDRYAPALKQLIRHRYRNALNAVADESDVALSVFQGLWNGAAAGKWNSVQDRTELWWLLVSITRHKAIKCRIYNTRQKRAGNRASVGEVQTRSLQNPILMDEVVDDQPPPELILMLQEEQDRLLGLLRDDVLRSIAIWKLEGLTHAEIAARLGVATRTVIRKLDLIRKLWAKELEQ